MKLADVKKKNSYRIESINTNEDVFNAKAYQLGLFPGAMIELRHLAPIFKDPMLFYVDDSLVALTKAEAEKINVSELGGNQ